MSREYCIIHNRKHNSDHGWRAYIGESGEVVNECLGFDRGKYPEFVPEYIKTDRIKNLASQIQSHRGGELSKEFVELYPDRVKGMVKSGAIKQEEVKRAKNIWTDLPGYHNLKKTQ